MLTARFSLPVLMLCVASQGLAQTTTGAGTNWNTSYGWPSAGDRSVRLQYLQTQENLSNKSGTAGGAGAPSHTTTNNYTNNYNHSVGDTVVTAAEGAHVSLENRTGPDSGTNTNTVGSINTTTSTVTLDGNGHVVDIVSAAENSGCLDGSINLSMNEIFETLDISASGGPTAGGSRSSETCNE